MKYSDLQNTARVKHENVDLSKLSVFEFGPLFWEEVSKSLVNLGFEKSELVITSGCDGVHSINSQHYVGKAVDMRIRNLYHKLGREVYSVFWWMLFTAAIKILGSKLPMYAFVIEKNHLHIQSNFENLKTDTGNISRNVWSNV
jgi:hypothetical protein